MKLINLNGTKVWATDSEQATLATLAECRKGGFASVHGYKPTTNWVEVPTQNIQFISRVSTQKVYERRLEALNNIQFSDIADVLSSEPKFAAYEAKKGEGSLHTLFTDRITQERNSLQKSLDSASGITVQSDAHREGHKRCYAQVDQGVKVNFVTESVKQADGNLIKEPVLNNGYPTIASIMVSALFTNVTTIVEGTRKVVNSGAPKLMGNAIQSIIGKTGVTIKMLSLKPDNFDHLSIDKNVILREDLHPYIKVA